VINTTPASREAYDANKLVRSHLVRNIQIIGEAAWRLSQPLKDQHRLVPWRLIAGMRHAIVHDYFEIDWNEVWNTATRDVPALRPLIAAALESLPRDEQ
jgi:uncharacterized protein with HEPN domain